ncbi:hypothetical protein BAQU_0614 [Bifidobacterium aquikefiri]|uniref:Prealbumin-like fold domain-containing protein n=2 Tax=Bifidobacterium aquikefiri TaxID=1653207 RepID=A0A261G955_9BIFI|nr:isopeptide-forming domain-containing fimbrial protein [Bifidobacterium aquikefiri]OZG67969.1 hypothetical protein BAQU_0614 [Bifidobacterium aquikefiri]
MTVVDGVLMLVSRLFGSVAGRLARRCSGRSTAALLPSARRGGGVAVSALLLSVVVLLSGLLAVSPAERATADEPAGYGPDGYFSTLSAGATPVIDADAATPGVAKDGWANTRRIVFGKSGVLSQHSPLTGTASVSGGYKTLAKGPVESVANANSFSDREGDSNIVKSATTSVAADEALLWADNVVTVGFAFSTVTAYTCPGGYTCNSFDSTGYKSQLALVSDVAGATNYSSFEQGLLRVALVEGVCTAQATQGCNSGSYTQQTNSVNDYMVFPLSVGDLNQYAGATNGWLDNVPDSNLACPSNTCANGVSGSWLRTARWNIAGPVFNVQSKGIPFTWDSYESDQGLRPAFRLGLDGLLLSAHSGDQSQVLNAPNSAQPDSLRLTFVDEGKRVSLSKKPYLAESGGVWRVTDLEGVADLEAPSGLGWKIVDPEDDSGVVVASGRTNYDAAAGSDGNMVVPCATLVSGREYDFYAWGQQDGSDSVGWSNRATEPVRGVVTKNAAGTCALKIASPPSYGIEVSGVSSGGLMAYRIGDYDETVFDQTGALQSVRLATPADPVKASVLAAAVAAGGSGVDVDNPVGWVAARWLGYPSDPLSGDTSSASSPYAGSLQLFAQGLAANTGGLSVAGSLPAGTFSSGGTFVLSVSGPGLYLIVDSSGASLPIIVGSKAFNEGVGEDGLMVDFPDAGVHGKPQLGRAVLKTSVVGVSKRVVNNGLQGFDMGASVEYEVALTVPDLVGFSGVTYDAYEFEIDDVATNGLTLPAAGSVRVLMDVDPDSGVASPDVDVTGRLSSSSIVVADKSLTVSGLKALFATDSGGHVANRATVPAGSLVRVRYEATVNVDALVSMPGGGGVHSNLNEATLTRSMAAGGTEGLTVSADVYTFGVDVVKVAMDDATSPLADAGFVVKRHGVALSFVDLGGGVYRKAVPSDVLVTTTLVTGGDGRLALRGVAAGGLVFEEMAAPSGYFKVPGFTVETVPVWNVDASGIELVSYRTAGTPLVYVSQDGHTVVVADPPVGLASLPYTGGVGIALLLLFAGAVAMLAIRPYYLAHCAEATANII